ncbi:MAG: hypothetical protein EOO23_07875 [Comamonadaceae bacterium]|nr:MAG: hypothetical protein EOO23_07875 [Comamonadaceae bacterium]
MKRSVFASIALFAGVAAMALAHYVVAPVVYAAVATCRWLKDFALDAFKVVGGSGEGMGRPALVRLVQAKAFVLRLAKRERPELTGSWRMCPST